MRRKGFTLIELLIVMAVIAILIAIAIPSFRGMQQEARMAKADGDVRVLKVAVESYYKNTGSYPAVANYQTTLLAASPKIIEGNLYDPFGATTTTVYKYDTSANDKYYVVWSIGIDGSDDIVGVTDTPSWEGGAGAPGDDKYATNAGL